MRGDTGRGAGVGGGAGWGHNDVNSKSTHAQTTGIYSIVDHFAWVRHVPP